VTFDEEGMPKLYSAKMFRGQGVGDGTEVPGGVLGPCYRNKAPTNWDMGRAARS